VGGGRIRLSNGHVFEIAEDAYIQVEGRPASVGQIKVGMQALVTSRVADFGETSKDTVYQAVRISARRNVTKKKVPNNNNNQYRTGGSGSSSGSSSKK